MLPCGRPCAPFQGIFVLQYVLDVLGFVWIEVGICGEGREWIREDV